MTGLVSLAGDDSHGLPGASSTRRTLTGRMRVLPLARSELPTDSPTSTPRLPNTL